jgi:hypothetical protein
MKIHTCYNFLKFQGQSEFHVCVHKQKKAAPEKQSDGTANNCNLSVKNGTTTYDANWNHSPPCMDYESQESDSDWNHPGRKG